MKSKRVVNCPYCSYEFAIEDTFFEDGWSLIHECVRCEKEYLITATEVKSIESEL